MRRINLTNVALFGILLGSLIGLPFFSAHAQSASPWIITGTGNHYLKPVTNQLGLLDPGLATSTTGCLAVASNGWVSASGSACGSAGGGAYPFTPSTYGTLNVSATTSAISDSAGFVSTASSTLNQLTVERGTTTNATSTSFKTTVLAVGTDILNDITGTGLSISGNALTVSGLTTSQFTSANVSQWTNDAGYKTFGWPFTATANYNSTSTPIGFLQGIFATASSTFSILQSASTTLTGNFVYGLATGTNATTTNFFATLASSTNLWGANLATCNGTTFLQWSAGLFGCGTPSGGGTWPFTPGTFGALAEQSTTTLYRNTIGIVAQGTSTIGDGTAKGGLTVSGNSTTSQALSAGADGFNVNNTGTITKLAGSAVSITSTAAQFNSSGGDVLIQNNVSTLGSRLKLQTTPVSGANNDPNSAITIFIGLMERARFTGNGFLGIGTTSPSALLDIYTQPGASGASTTLFRISSSTPTATTSIFQVNNVGVASSTGLVVTGLNAASCDVKADTNGLFSCGTDSVGAGTFPFTPDATNFGTVASNATTTPIWFKGNGTWGLFASSTSVFSNASTSQLTVTGAEWHPGITDKLLSSDVNGKMYGSATSSASCGSGITCSGFTVVGSVSPAFSIATNALTLSQFPQVSANRLIGNASGAAANAAEVATSSLFTGTVGNYAYFSGTGTLIGTSTLSLNTTGQLGVGSTTPWGEFSIELNAKINPAFVVSNLGSTTPAFIIGGVNQNGNIGIASTSPWANLSVGIGNGSSTASILVAEHRPATTTTITIDARNGNQQTVRLGTAATTITITGFTDGTSLRILTCNPNSTAGAVTWATTPTGALLWTGGSAPAQTTTAKKCDVWSFLGTQATSTLTLLGAQTPNF